MLGLKDVPEHSRLWGLGLRALWNFWWDQLYEKVKELEIIWKFASPLDYVEQEW